MTTIVSMNPCIDKTIYVNDFRKGALNRVSESMQNAAGKAINVALVAKNLGAQVRCVGFNYRENGDILNQRLDNGGVPYEFVTVAGTLRTNTKITDVENNELTELNEAGGGVRAEDVERLKKRILALGEESDTVALCGSVPPGVDITFYRDIIAQLNKRSVKVILDAEKNLLLESMKGKPYLIKPNIHEFQTAFGTKLSDKKSLLSMAREIIRDGVQTVCISLGGDGAMICTADEGYYAPPIDIKVLGIQGAGDSMVAGFCCAIEKGLPLSELLRYGMAASAGSLVQPGTELCTMREFREYYKLAVVEEIV